LRFLAVSRGPGRHEGARNSNLSQVDNQAVHSEPRPQQREGQVLQQQQQHNSMKKISVSPDAN